MQDTKSKLDYYIEFNEYTNTWDLIELEPDTDNIELIVSVDDLTASNDLVTLKRQLVGLANSEYNLSLKLNEVEYSLG